MLANLPFVNFGYTLSRNSDLSGHFLLAILLRYIHVFQWFYEWIKHTICVNQFTVLILGTFGNSTVVKKDSLESDLSRHFVLAILLRHVMVISWFDRSIKQTLCVRSFTVSIWGTLVYGTVI